MFRATAILGTLVTCRSRQTEASAVERSGGNLPDHCSPCLARSRSFVRFNAPQSQCQVGPCPGTSMCIHQPFALGQKLASAFLRRRLFAAHGDGTSLQSSSHSATGTCNGMSTPLPLAQRSTVQSAFSVASCGNQGVCCERATISIWTLELALAKTGPSP